MSTAVLFLHHGEPRRDAKAFREFLTHRASIYYRVPYSVSRYVCFISYHISFHRSLINCYFNLNGDRYVNRLVVDSTNLADPNTQLDEQSTNVTRLLNEMVPDLGPFRCFNGFLLQQPTIEQAISEIYR